MMDNLPLAISSGIDIIETVTSPDKMKQVAVRMSDRLHQEALRQAQAEKISFGELVRRCVDDHIEFMKGPRARRRTPQHVSAGRTA